MYSRHIYCMHTFIPYMVYCIINILLKIFQIYHFSKQSTHIRYEKSHWRTSAYNFANGNNYNTMSRTLQMQMLTKTPKTKQYSCYAIARCRSIQYILRLWFQLPYYTITFEPTYTSMQIYIYACKVLCIENMHYKLSYLV